MRILHVFTDLGTGGVQKMIIQLAADAVSRGDAVTVASAGGPSEDPLREAGGAHATVSLGGRSASTTAVGGLRLASTMRRVRPDVVHAHNVRPALAARLAIMLCAPRTPLLTTLHGLAPRDYANAARLLRLAGGRVIACAPAVSRQLRAAGYPQHRLDVITNGAALQPPTPQRVEALRSRLGTGRAPLVVGVGRLAPQKDWPTLIAAASRLEDAGVVVAGDGALHRSLEDAAESGGGRVRFVGRLEDVAALYAIAACTVSTSTWEGLPLSLLEALSLGVPSVATAVDGVADVVPASAALLVPPGDPGAVADAVNRVLHEPGLAERLGAAALEASRAWSPQAMLDAYREAYRRAVGAPNQRSRTGVRR